MSPSQRIYRYGITFIFGVFLASLIARVIGKIWLNAAWPVFLCSVLFWVVVGIQLFIRDMQTRGDALGEFRSTRDWRPEALPAEFRFVTHDTTLREVAQKAGDYRSVRHPVMGSAARYDLPDGGAIFMYTEPPFSLGSKIRGIQLYRSEASIPLFFQ